MNVKGLISRVDAETINKAAAQIIKDMAKSTCDEFIMRVPTKWLRRALTARRRRQPKVLIDSNRQPGKRSN